MTLRALVLYIIPLTLLAIVVITVLVTKWQRRHVVLSADEKRPVAK